MAHPIAEPRCFCERREARRSGGPCFRTLVAYAGSARGHSRRVPVANGNALDGHSAGDFLSRRASLGGWRSEMAQHLGTDCFIDQHPAERVRTGAKIKAQFCPSRSCHLRVLLPCGRRPARSAPDARLLESRGVGNQPKGDLPLGRVLSHSVRRARRVRAPLVAEAPATLTAWQRRRTHRRLPRPRHPLESSCLRPEDPEGIQPGSSGEAQTCAPPLGAKAPRA
jgi:hypothetical protein